MLPTGLLGFTAFALFPDSLGRATALTLFAVAICFPALLELALAVLAAGLDCLAGLAAGAAAAGLGEAPAVDFTAGLLAGALTAFTALPADLFAGLVSALDFAAGFLVTALFFAAGLGAALDLGLAGAADFFAGALAGLAAGFFAVGLLAGLLAFDFAAALLAGFAVDLAVGFTSLARAEVRVLTAPLRAAGLLDFAALFFAVDFDFAATGRFLPVS